jgi:hypothetical protein
MRYFGFTVIWRQGQKHTKGSNYDEIYFSVSFVYHTYAWHKECATFYVDDTWKNHMSLSLQGTRNLSKP